MGDEESTHPSLCPPSHGYSPSDAPPTGWVLLDLHAFIADRKNATSAYGKMSNGKAIRVTFCTAPQPLVSYICVWCPDLPPTELGMHPTIEAAEADLVLFRVSLRSDLYSSDYFVYKASGSNGPSLRRIEDFRSKLSHGHTAALLARRDFGEGGHIGQSTDDDDHFYIAVLNQDVRTFNFNLCIYNSVDKIWSVSAVSPVTPYVHVTGKVITLGQCGLLGFVDPWRGILVCDIADRKSVHYLPLPHHLGASDKASCEPRLFRDVALVEGRLTLVELHPSTDPHSSTKNRSWNLSTWSISSPWKGQDDWRMDYTVEFGDVVVDGNNDNTDLLARLLTTGEASQRSLGRLHLAHPILSLNDKYVVYLMGKDRIRDKKALVLSVDMKSSRLQGCAVFDAERMAHIFFSYTCIQSTISSYFNMAPGAKGKHKRSGKFHMLYPRKYQSGVTMNDGAMTSHIPVGVHECQDSGAEGGDNDMLLD